MLAFCVFSFFRRKYQTFELFAMNACALFVSIHKMWIQLFRQVLFVESQTVDKIVSASAFVSNWFIFKFLTSEKMEDLKN